MFRDRQMSMANRVIEFNNGVKIRVLNRISEGQYADVYKVMRNTDNKFFALKKLRLLEDNTNAFTNLKNELSTLGKVDKNNPHLVKMIEKYETKLNGGSQRDVEVYLLQELCPSKL